MDEDGLIAINGKINEKLLDFLMMEKFILRIPPKSTGRDEFGQELVMKVRNSFSDLKTEDLIRTFSFFTAKSIAININNFLKINPNECRMIVSGGGVNHKVVMSDISFCTKIMDIKKSDEYDINSNMKETLLMAVLGLAKMLNLSASMPSVTGAQREMILGENL